MNDAPSDNLFRGDPRAPEIRAEGDTPGSLMVGHFSRFDAWYEIDSWYEGRFLERTVPGAFKRTIKNNRSSMKVQFDHGYDATIGDALLGPIDMLREDDEGPYFEVPLLDTDYNRDRILPMLSTALLNGETRGTSLLGTSFRFRVIEDEWNHEPAKSKSNPERLPERTITEARVMEFGPVVWPASEAADVGVRSLSDYFETRRLARLGMAERAARDLGLIVPGPPSAPGEPETPPDGTSREATPWLPLSVRRQRAAKLRGVAA